MVNVSAVGSDSFQVPRLIVTRLILELLMVSPKLKGILDKTKKAILGPRLAGL